MNSSNISKRHHYLPITYLKGFCNEKNEFYIFDKEKWKVKDRPLSPKTHFFEYDRNTITIENVKTDVLEKAYKAIDDELKNFLKNINEKSTLLEALGNEGITKLKFFISNLFWRIPASEKYEQLVFNILNEMQSLGVLNIEDEDLKNEILFNDESFRKYARFFILPELTFLFSDSSNVSSKWNFIYAPENSNWGKHLTCDNPIIFDNTNDFFALRNKIMFPISRNKTLICLENIDITKPIPKLACIQFDLAVFSNAIRYVCSSDKDYLNDMASLYTDTFKLYKLETNKRIISKTFSCLQ